MSQPRIIQEIARKQSDKPRAALRVAANPELLPDILNGLDSEKPSIRYGCARVLRLISETNPELLVPCRDLFVRHLEGENNILRWNAIYIVGNLVVTDGEGWFESLFDRFFAPICGSQLIAAGNTICSAGAVALAKPALSDRIAAELMKTENARYATPECRNVALGQAIASFDRFYDLISDKKSVIDFVRRHLLNTRPATARKAARFLKTHQL